MVAVASGLRHSRLVKFGREFRFLREIAHTYHMKRRAEPRFQSVRSSDTELDSLSANGGRQPDAASFMILTIASSTSCATPSNCGVSNIASNVVGFKVARMVLSPSA